MNADERILSFHSDITVLTDGSMQVRESITVRAEQDRIQRGIYRDFPTVYNDQLGNRFRVDFTPVSVQRDGTEENFFRRNMSNGVRTYFGRENVILDPGEYTYTFYYQTNRQLGFYENYDELYWNVTGNGWEFPIDSATARVFLPETVPDSRINATAYTGATGSREQAFSENRFSGGDVFFETTRPLDAREGLTIIVSWPKGHVREPDFEEKLGYLYRDNRHLVFGLTGLLILLSYYLYTWHLVGRDPESDVIFTRYEPPPGYSPASLRYVMELGYDRKCLAAAIINLAVKGYLSISENDREYTLTRTGKKVDMAPGESALAGKLFKGGTSITLQNSNHKTISDALEAHEDALSRNYETRYFITNSGYFIVGIILSIVIVIGVLLSMPDFDESAGALFITAWLTGWSVGVLVLVKSALAAWTRIKGAVSLVGAVYVSLFALVFAGIEVFVIFSFARDMDVSAFLVILGAAGINWSFYELLKAPTMAGRRLMDKIEGFRRYIEVAEKQQLDRKHPKGRTPELFESYLPYALAMEVEQKWAEKFADVLVKVSANNKSAYHPVWYTGSCWEQNNIGDFSSSLGSGFSQAIASSATAPGSGSGGGGGGFSGGGGGGGGGGGW